MPPAKKKPAVKKKAAAAKTAPTAAPVASPAGPDPVVAVGYQLGNVLVFGWPLRILLLWDLAPGFALLCRCFLMKASSCR